MILVPLTSYNLVSSSSLLIYIFLLIDLKHLLFLLHLSLFQLLFCLAHLVLRRLRLLMLLAIFIYFCYFYISLSNISFSTVKARDFVIPFSIWKVIGSTNCLYPFGAFTSTNLYVPTDKLVTCACPFYLSLF